MLNRFNLFFVIISLVYMGCTSSSPLDSQYKNIYQTDHFIIHYEESTFSIFEIEQIAAKKERLVEYLNATLNLTYDGRIDIYLYLCDNKYAYTHTFADGHMVIYESRDYVMGDDGHEIAHAIVFDKLGRSINSFMVEGLAVFSELNLIDYNIIEKFVDYHRLYQQSQTDSISISTQILKPTFNSSYYSYCQAGAFLKYLTLEYGLENVKALYIKSITANSDTIASYIESTFNKDINAIEKDFLLHCFPDSLLNE